MQAFLNRMMAGRAQAVSWATLTALLTLFLAPLSFFLGLHVVCGAIVGLATLRNGALEGAVVMVGASVLTAGAVWIALSSPAAAVQIVGLTWFPVWVTGGVLHMSSSLGLALAAGAALGLLGVTGFRVAVGDPASWWEQFWRARLTPGGSGTAEAGDIVPQLLAMLDTLAPVTTGIFGAASLLVLSLTLFLARWWHGILDNPGGFAREFHALAVPKAASWLTIGLGLAVVVTSGGWRDLAMEMVLVLAVFHLLGGLAIVHDVVARRRASRGWLVLLYLLLLLVPVSSPYVAMSLALAGFTDAWVRYRERIAPKTT